MRQEGRITVVSGTMNAREAIRKALTDFDGLHIALVPWGMQNDATGTPRAVNGRGDRILVDNRSCVALHLLYVLVLGFGYTPHACG